MLKGYRYNLARLCCNMSTSSDSLSSSQYYSCDNLESSDEYEEEDIILPNRQLWISGRYIAHVIAKHRHLPRF